MAKNHQKYVYIWGVMAFWLGTQAWAGQLPWQVGQCQQPSWQNALRCGEFSANLSSLYYSTHDAYFVENLNQDTAAIGGVIKYSVQPSEQLSAGISYALQRRLDDKNTTHAEVAELAPERDGLAEAYLRWQPQDWQITLGQQSLDLPFVGDYNWRIMPPLYRAIDIKWQQDTDFIRMSAVDRFKSYSQDQFNRGSRYSTEIETDGMWSIGAGKTWKHPQHQLKTELWYQRYLDYADLAYSETHLSWPKQPRQPDLGLQVMWGQQHGQAYAGKVQHIGVGGELGLQVWEDFRLKLGYNYIHPEKNSYLNGALFAPYMIYTASGPYFAQPFFTSTQDLGSGHAWRIAVEGPINERVYLGGQYSFMHLNEDPMLKDLNQSEWVFYGFYDFGRWAKGLSLAHFVGFATSPRADDPFLQNRLALRYKF